MNLYFNNICNVSFTLGAVAHGQAFFGAGIGLIHLDDLMCTGREDSLFSCPFDPTHNCFHSEDAGVTCVAESKI